MQNENVGYLSKNKSILFKSVKREGFIPLSTVSSSPPPFPAHKIHGSYSLKVILFLEKLSREMDFTAHLCKKCCAAKQNKENLLSSVLLQLTAYL